MVHDLTSGVGGTSAKTASDHAITTKLTRKTAGSVTPWWKNGTCYQVWPTSFKDSNGDGVGDIPGLISALDYLQDLGVDFIWLSPMYDSPQRDMGYDISNYEDVWSKFGTLSDMDSLIHEAHSRGLRLILDLVVNHTSDEHYWFQQSRMSKDNPYSDWYIWKEAKIINGSRQPPNNWRGAFGGSAWHYASERDQYYLHLFTQYQPDLNWENPQTRKAIYESAIEFWLKKGIDGFRVDTVNLYSKTAGYPDAPITDPDQTYQFAESLYVNGPRMHEWLQEQHKEAVDKYGDIFLVGELPSTSAEEVRKYVSTDSRELDCVFDFGICETGGRYGRAPHETWQPTLLEMKAAFQKTQDLIRFPDAWTTVFGENHDQARTVSMYGSKNPCYLTQSARLLAILLTTLSGTLFVYQGQEIGMTGLPADARLDCIQDVCGLDYLADIQRRYPGDAAMSAKAHASLVRVGRDNARTPMQWTAGSHAGFTTGTPWTRVNPNHVSINVEASQRDPCSVLATWKQMLKLRKQYADVMIHGQFEMCDVENVSTFTFLKRSSERSVLVALNFSDSEQRLHMPTSLYGKDSKLLFTNGKPHGDVLGPWEGRVYLMQ